jgi:hypothetical protein
MVNDRSLINLPLGFLATQRSQQNRKQLIWVEGLGQEVAHPSLKAVQLHTSAA